MAAKTTFVLEADEAKAVRAYLRVVDAQNKATDGLRKMNREGRGASKSMEGVGRSVAGWLAGFASIGTIIQGIKSIVREMEKATALRKEMHETALTTEQLSLKIAHLRRDVTEGGIAAVTKDMAEISKQAAVSLQSAATTLFYAESAMGAGTARARSAAMAISKFAGPAGLTPEETMLIPKLFDIMKADTEKRQMQVLNQLRAATAASIAETGEFIAPFMKPLVADIQRGFTLPQSLARMVAAVQVTGNVEAAGTISATALDIAAGRTQQALKFYGEQARKRGIDYAALTDPERYEFARRLFKEAQAGGPGLMDVLKTKVGAKGFRAIRAIFGEAGERKYFEVLPEIETAITSTAVQQMAGQYLRLLTAESIRQATQREIGRTQIGIERRPEVVLGKEVTAALEAAKGGVKGWGGFIRFGLTPERFEKRFMAQILLQENLLLALEATGKGTPERAALLQLYTQTWEPKPFAIRPDYLERIYRATEGFGLIAGQGRLVPEAFREEIFEEMGMPEYGKMYRKRRPEYIQGLQYQYGLQGEEQAIQKLSDATIKLDNAATKLENSINLATRSVPGPEE